MVTRSNAQNLMGTGVPAVTANEIVRQATTSGLQIGTTSTTAMAGNRSPTTTIRGGVLTQAAIPNIAAAPTQADFNGLLTALRAAGVLTP